MFESLPDNVSYPALESAILAYWTEHNVFERTQQDTAGKPLFTFYEGPPTVNGRPGIHHVLARTVKDAMCRYKTMQGYAVRRQAGWDTHGLPVEIAAEKQLGITDKSQIEEIGVQKFNAECRAIVDTNIDMQEGWRTLTRRMGYWLDMDAAYVTCTNDYIESVWWALQRFFEKGLIYKGFKVVPQSPTLGTPLSSHELSQNYKEVRDANLYVMASIASSPTHQELLGAELLVWTTTPWTLFANVALAVGANIPYVLVHVRHEKKDGTVLEHRLVLAESRLSILDGEVTVVGRYSGADLVGIRYEQILPYLTLDTAAHPATFSVVAGDFVSTEDGSGIVHIAPAFGQDDFEVSKQYNLPMPQPVTPHGRFTDEVGEFAGRTVKTFTYTDHVEEGADRDIVIRLKELGRVYRSSFDYVHSYPHCWRTDNPVIYYARDSWFIASPRYKDELVRNNKLIQWHPPEIGEGRFGNWLDDVKDWSLSRDRYWGTPLPIWVREDGEDMFAVGSIAELMGGYYEFDDGRRVPLAESGIEVDLHRPFVDRVVFVRDGHVYRRTREVVDVWFDSGSMPFAQLHYPFENADVFEQSFPADFIAEGIDQTRGWFYTLHNISTALFGQPAYKHVVVNDLVLDKNGQKMSKSKGNTVDPFQLFDRYGADAIRWYLMSASPVWKPKLFNEEEISRTVVADFFRSLANTYEFFALYANVDGYQRSATPVAIADRPEIDRWIISRLQSIRAEYVKAMDGYDITRGCRLIQEFAVEDLSNWYVRRNRRRFWKGDFDTDKQAAYDTLYEVLVAMAELTAPVAPFLAETLYLRLHAQPVEISVHCCILPAFEKSVVDTELERRMQRAQTIVSLARSLREKARIKTRQPLRRILVPVDSPATRRDIQLVEDIIIEEINVKEIEYVSDDTNIVQRSAKPNFKVIGKKYGEHTKRVADAIRLLDNEQVRQLEQSSVLAIEIEDVTVQIDFEDVEIVSEDIEGWLVATEGATTVALDTEIDQALEREGLAREFVSRLQKLRKDSGYAVTDRIRIEFDTDIETAEAFLSMRSYIAMETLAITLERGEQLQGVGLEINGRHVNVRVERVV